MFDFEEAAPTRGDAMPNPFLDVIKTLIDTIKTEGQPDTYKIKLDDKGAALAKAFWIPAESNSDSDKLTYSRRMRQLGEVGNAFNFSVQKEASDVIKPGASITKANGQTSTNKLTVPAVLVTFWLGTPVKRPRKKTATIPTPAVKTTPEAPAEQKDAPAETPTAPAETPAVKATPAKKTTPATKTTNG